MPPFLSKRGEAGEDGIYQNRDDQRLGPAEIVRGHPEADSSDGPPDQENRKHYAAVPPDLFVRDGSAGGPGL
jgi:hypothetical protein